MNIKKLATGSYEDVYLISRLVSKEKNLAPTVFREDGYRFFFFSREESRMHVHVLSGDGEAKYWLEPEIALAKSFGYSNK